jgi:hypothetical protein
MRQPSATNYPLRRPLLCTQALSSLQIISLISVDPGKIQQPGRAKQTVSLDVRQIRCAGHMVDAVLYPNRHGSFSLALAPQTDRDRHPTGNLLKFMSRQVAYLKRTIFVGVSSFLAH